MTPPLLAQLNRRLKTRGEPILLRRPTGSGANRTYVQCRIPGIIRTTSEHPLTANVVQLEQCVLISPTHIRQQGWPGGQVPPTRGGIIEPTDPRLPTATDIIIVRGLAQALSRVAAIFDAGVCVRIVLFAKG